MTVSDVTSTPGSWSRAWSRADLEHRGFRGFVRFADLPGSDVPTEPGVYVIVRPHAAGASIPAFMPSSAGWFKGKDPGVPRETLRDAWVPAAVVVYIGKAGGGANGRRGLRKRLDEYRRIGAGQPVGHWGGRFIWQLAERDELLVAWLPTPAVDPEAFESDLITEFVAAYGQRPFANRKAGKAKPA